MATAIQGVLLDVDDTLLDTRAAFRVGIAHVARRWLLHLDEDGVDDATLRWAHDPGGHFRAYNRGELTFAEQRRLRVADLHATYGGPQLDDAGFAAWDDEFGIGFQAGWRLHDDVERLLTRLAEAGVAVGLITNSRRDLTLAKLEHVGLTGRLRLLVSPDDLGVGKPDPRVFHLACERLGTAPARTAYVGDEWDTDARAARAAGLVGVWVDRFHQRESLEPGALSGVLVAGDLDDVPGLLHLPAIDLGALDARR